MSEAAEVCVYTIGHSNRSFDDFVSLLRGFGIRRLVDIRRFPASRRWPHFNRDGLAAGLHGAGIGYRWIEALGGRRRGLGRDSPNGGLRVAGFRNYADYMMGDEFRRGVDELLGLARACPTAVMCAEALYWQCHRRLLSDFLQAGGVAVRHIMGPKQLREHRVTPTAVFREGAVAYPPPLFGGSG